MPKLKTNRGAAKRFKLIKSGKIKRSKAYLRHILTSKTTKQKRNLRSGTMISRVDSPRVKRMLAGN